MPGNYRGRWDLGLGLGLLVGLDQNRRLEGVLLRWGREKLLLQPRRQDALQLGRDLHWLMRLRRLRRDRLIQERTLRLRLLLRLRLDLRLRLGLGLAKGRHLLLRLRQTRRKMERKLLLLLWLLLLRLLLVLWLVLEPIGVLGFRLLELAVDRGLAEAVGG